MFYMSLPLRNFPHLLKTFFKLITALALKKKLTLELDTTSSFDVVLLMTGLQLSYKRIFQAQLQNIAQVMSTHGRRSWKKNIK